MLRNVSIVAIICLVSLCSGNRYHARVVVAPKNDINEKALAKSMSEVTGFGPAGLNDTKTIDTAVSSLKSGYLYEFDGAIASFGQSTLVSYGVPNLSTGATSQCFEWYDGFLTAVWDGETAQVSPGDHRANINPLEFLLLGGTAPHGFKEEQVGKTTVWNGAFPDRFSAKVVVKWPDVHGGADEIWSSATEVELYDTVGGRQNRLMARASRVLDALDVTWKLERYRGADTVVSTSTYDAFIVDDSFPKLASLLKPGVFVVDSRLSASQPANYTWTGELPTSDKLKKSSGAELPKPILSFVAAVVIGILGILLLFRSRCRATKMNQG